MKRIYDYTEQSSSYWGGWTNYNYYLCETEQEYQECIEKARKEKEDYAARGYAANISVTEDTRIAAREHFVRGAGWAGKEFDAFGLEVYKRFERSNEYNAYIKPGTLTEKAKQQRKVSFMDTLTDS